MLTIRMTQMVSCSGTLICLMRLSRCAHLHEDVFDPPHFAAAAVIVAAIFEGSIVAFRWACRVCGCYDGCCRGNNADCLGWSDEKSALTWAADDEHIGGDTLACAAILSVSIPVEGGEEGTRWCLLTSYQSTRRWFYFLRSGQCVLLMMNCGWWLVWFEWCINVIIISGAVSVFHQILALLRDDDALLQWVMIVPLFSWKQWRCDSDGSRGRGSRAKRQH